MGSFVFASNMSYTLVASREENDKDEREEEGEGASDAPLAKDDAEVFGRPGKNHLRGTRLAMTSKYHHDTQGTYVHAALIPHVHIAMAAVPVIHIVHSMHRVIHLEWKAVGMRKP